MKKYISFIAIAFVALFTSCSNDDITIEASTTVNINAAGVIAPFTWEYNPGELEAFGSLYRLRLRALVYNDKGELVEQASDLFTNYNVQLKSSISLSAGKYTVIGISDVVAVQNESITGEFWNLTGENKLSEMLITDNGKIGNFAKVLGIAKNTINIEENRTNSVDVNLQPAGALIYTFFTNTAALSLANISHYKLLANKSCESISFDGLGNYSIVEKQEPNMSYRIARVEASSDTYRWNFLLPMKNVELWFACEQDGETKTFAADDGAIVDVVDGDEFACEIILNSDVSQIQTLYYYMNKTASSRAQVWANKWKNRVNVNSSNIGYSIFEDKMEKNAKNPSNSL